MEVQLATVLPGARGFKEGNINETFRGQVLLADGSTRGAVLKDLDPKQLANEVLASVLAQASGLPTPDIYLALVRGADLPVTKAPQLYDGNRVVFPRQLKIAARCAGWRESAVNEWMNNPIFYSVEDHPGA